MTRERFSRHSLINKQVIMNARNYVDRTYTIARSTFTHDEPRLAAMRLVPPRGRWATMCVHAYGHIMLLSVRVIATRAVPEERDDSGTFLCRVSRRLNARIHIAAVVGGRATWARGRRGQVQDMPRFLPCRLLPLSSPPPPSSPS